MVAPTLTLEQYQYDDTGVLLNGSVALPFVDVTSVDGLDNAPIRETSHEREGTDGGFVDAQYQSIRTVTVEGTIYALPTDIETYLDSLKANFAPSAVVKPLYFKTDGAANTDRLVFCKSMGIRFTKDARRRLGIVDFQIQFRCEDPRIYSVTLQTLSVGTPIVLGGNRTTAAKILVNGAQTNPVITLGSSVFTCTLTIAAASTVTIDLDARSITRNVAGVITNVRSNVVITGGWPRLGPTSTTFTKTGTGAGTTQLTARAAWQ